MSIVQLFRSFGNKKKADLGNQVSAILAAHQEELFGLHSDSDDALTSFHKTVERIDGINDQIDISTDRIEEAINSLTETRNRMVVRKASNQRVRSKIIEILGE